MVVTYLLICLVPVALIIVVFVVTGAAAMKVARAGRRMYTDILPDINELKETAARAQQKSLEFSERGKKLSEAFEEIAGRWAFITKTLSETTKSPIVKFAEIAGKHAGRKAEG
jgi:hypothetical protein